VALWAQPLGWFTFVELSTTLPPCATSVQALRLKPARRRPDVNRTWVGRTDVQREDEPAQPQERPWHLRGGSQDEVQHLDGSIRLSGNDPAREAHDRCRETQPEQVSGA
jgi:hypothetical protein